ncbi:hypothetical protein BDW67DRAFT_64073 [Aspergillus spinulosporus]
MRKTCFIAGSSFTRQSSLHPDLMVSPIPNYNTAQSTYASCIGKYYKFQVHKVLSRSFFEQYFTSRRLPQRASKTPFAFCFRNSDPASRDVFLNPRRFEVHLNIASYGDARPITRLDPVQHRGILREKPTRSTLLRQAAARLPLEIRADGMTVVFGARRCHDSCVNRHLAFR